MSPKDSDSEYLRVRSFIPVESETMKKTFPLTAAGKADARVVEAIKRDVRKYVNRERKKPLPEGFELWEFACKVGVDQQTAESKTLREVGVAIDAVASAGAGAGTVYIEILAVPSHRLAPLTTTQPAAASTVDPATASSTET
jgi:hypothetical protein